MFKTDYPAALDLDKQDDLREYRNRFHIPVQKDGQPYLYFCGNSLGCQPRRVRDYIEIELADWQRLGVEGHFLGKNPWKNYHEFLTDSTARLVGALPSEVVVMNSLTTNLHLLMATFYRPTAKKHKILIESDAFPSDAYAMESQLRLHGFDPQTSLIKIYPRQGETCIRTEDIDTIIEEQGDEIALILIGGVNYYTGQVFDMQHITQKGHSKNIIVGFDLAHAAGNLVLKLHEWNVDFAAWCSYKYLNGGPGGVSGVFIHEKHATNPETLRLAGWWGHEKESRFQMRHGFIPIHSAEGWQLSNAPVLSMAALRASMEIFDEVGMERLNHKSALLTAYLEFLLLHHFKGLIEIITPTNPKERGCQLSIRFHQNGKKIHTALGENGVICDWREPDVVRLAPVPLYNSFLDVWQFVEILKKIVNESFNE